MISKRSIRKGYVAGLLLAGLLVATTWGQTQAFVHFQVEPQSKLWIEGTSTVNSFSCQATEVDGQGRLRSEELLDVRSVEAEGKNAEAEVVMPVRQFDCGKRRMNADLYEALKADTYPRIRYELEQASVHAAPDADDGWYRLHVVGQLTLGGTERRILMDVQGRRLADGRFRVVGSKPLLMSDFGIEPPTALLGLVKAHDRIVVRFDLRAAAEAVHRSGDREERTPAGPQSFGSQ